MKRVRGEDGSGRRGFKAKRLEVETVQGEDGSE